MSFYWPIAFYFLLVPLALAALELRRRANGVNAHPKILRAEAGPSQLSLTQDSTAAKTSFRVRWRLWLGLALAIVALARPQWGRLEEPVFDQSREIIIALDLSRSMLSEDVRPSRLERAKLLVSSLLERLNGERVGLVVFSGTAFLQSPLSADYEIFREFLPDLNTRFLPEGGTDYASLLKTSLTAFGDNTSADRYLIILSDGEATDDDWKPLASELKTKGIRVIGLGIGTDAGAMIPDGAGGFVKDERGAVVLSKLESSTLQQLATETNGVYADASAWVDLAQLIESTVDTGRQGSFEEHSRVRLIEHFQWALAPALLLLLWSFWREFPVRPRLRDVKLTAPPPPLPAQKLNPASALSASALQSFSPFLLLIAYTLPLITCPPPARAEEKEPPAAEPLSKLVASYSVRDDLGARDYGEFARTTLTYGQKLKSSKKEVPAGPIHDGLAAVNTGRTLDAKGADWASLQRDLEALLKKDEPPSKEQPKEQPQQKQPEEKKDQQKDQQQQQQNSSPQNQQEKPPEKPDQPEQKNDSAQPPPPPKDQSAFGDMKNNPGEKSDKPPPPADPNEQQKVGGTPEKKEGDENKDPALAVPLQKLDQLKNQDSPVQLYQLMQNQKPSSKKTGKDW